MCIPLMTKNADHLFFFFLIIYLLIFGWAGSLLCHTAFSSCSKQGLLFLAVHGVLTGAASLVVEHRPLSAGAPLVVA